MGQGGWAAEGGQGGLASSPQTGGEPGAGVNLMRGAPGWVVVLWILMVAEVVLADWGCGSPPRYFRRCFVPSNRSNEGRNNGLSRWLCPSCPGRGGAPTRVRR